MIRALLRFALVPLAALALLTPSAPVARGQQPAQLTFRLYVPILFNQLPRPYQIPQNAVAVVQSREYCRTVNTYLSVCRVAGEVFNSTAGTVRGVVVEQRICDFRGQTIRTERRPLLLPALAPGQASAFAYYEEYSEGANEDRLCGASVVQSAAGAAPTSLTVVTQERTTRRDPQNYLITRVAGTVRNAGSTSLASATVLVTLYDLGGGIVDARTQTLPGPIGPGATVNFSVEFAGAPEYQTYSGRVFYHTVQAQAP